MRNESTNEKAGTGTSTSAGASAGSGARPFELGFFTRNDKGTLHALGIMPMERRSLEAAAEPLPLEKTALTAAESAILKAVPHWLRSELEGLFLSPPASMGGVEEVRFRVGSPVQLLFAHGEAILPQLPFFTALEAERMLAAVCENSMYAKETELEKGCVSMQGGVRVGLCGTPEVQNGRIVRFLKVCAFNFRVPRERLGCAEKLMCRLTRGGLPKSFVIAAPPGVGKTTFLRDCARCFSNGIGLEKAFKTAVIDERYELAGGPEGGLNVGKRTDVMSGISKCEALPFLIRNMSPQVVITEELNGKQELEAVEDAARCGVAVVSSIHAGSLRELKHRPGLRTLFDSETVKPLFLKRERNEFRLVDALEPAAVLESRSC